MSKLEFEKPILELEAKIADLKTHSREHDINFESEVLKIQDLSTLGPIFHGVAP